MPNSKEFRNIIRRAAQAAQDAQVVDGVTSEEYSALDDITFNLMALVDAEDLNGFLKESE